MAPVVEAFGGATLGIGASCILAIAVAEPPFKLLLLLLFGAGAGAGAQGGINALSGLIYPPAIRATGAGWALGFGRVGGVVGPLLGGTLLAHGLSPHQLYAIAAVPACSAMALMAVLGRLPELRHEARPGL